MWCAIYLCCLMVSGYPLAAGLAVRATRMEVAGLTMCLGPGVVGMLLIFLSMLGLRPAGWEILIITAFLGIAGVFVWRNTPKRERLDLGVDRPSKWWVVVCLVGLGYGIYAVASDALINPTIEWDAFAIWQLKAQMLAVLPLRPRPDYFFNVNLSFSHLRYPLLAPMVSAGMHAMTGYLDDLGKMVSLFWFVGMELVVFATVSRSNGTTAALTASALLACAPAITRYGGAATAEMPLTAFYACGVVCILRWNENRQWGYLLLAAIFSAFMAWTKNEGLALAVANAIVVGLCGRGGKWKQSLMAAASFALIVAVLYSPWIIYAWGFPRTDEDYAGRLNAGQIIHHLGRVGSILAEIGLELVNWEDFGLFWIIAAILAIWQWRRFKSPAVAVLGILLLLHWLVYVPPLVVTNWNLQDLMAVTVERLLMHAAPAGAILIGLLWPTGKVAQPGRAP